jgi:hypothetical protein
MNRRPNLLYTALAYGAIYPLLLALLVGGTLACSLLLNLSHRLIAPEPPPPQIQRLAALPGPSTPRPPQPARPSDRLAAITIATLPPLPPAPPPDPLLAPAQATPPAEIAAALPPPTSPAMGAAPPASPTSMALDLAVYANRPTATRAPRSTAAPDDLLGGLVTGLMGQAEAPTPAVGSLNSLPSLTPTPTATSTPPPHTTPPVRSPSPAPPRRPHRNPHRCAAAHRNPRCPPPPHRDRPPHSATAPPPTNTPETHTPPLPPIRFFTEREFFNSPTNNHFLVMYVSIVDTNEIPIGDMKIIGIRQDHNLTYESTLSTCHYEGYNAPGEVIKSGNVKFEPPGGIEDTAWVFYLADAHGNRMSDDVPFTTTATDRQWYFVSSNGNFRVGGVGGFGEFWRVGDYWVSGIVLVLWGTMERIETDFLNGL